MDYYHRQHYSGYCGIKYLSINYNVIYVRKNIYKKGKNMYKNRVVITGLGAITPLGNNVNDYWNNLKQGNIGIANISYFDTKDFKVKIAGEVKDFNAIDYMEKKSARRMALFSQYAIGATKQAIDQSKLHLSKEDTTRIGVSIGSGIGGLDNIYKESIKLYEKRSIKISPMLVPLSITNIAAGNVAISFGLKGKCINIVTACATGTHSIGEAFRTIANNEADVMIAGGTESCICPLGVASFSSLTALSTNEDWSKASRPFDKNRDGFVMGEGAGILVMESLEHATKRNADILAEIVGYGATCDAYHIVLPDETGEGSAKSMEIAIREAGIKKEEISYINAHGTSTYHNDLVETKAIKSVFGEYAYKIPISSTKSMIGHLLGAAGGVEAITCIMSIRDKFIHPTKGYETKDENCDLDYVPKKGRNTDIKYALSNSLGFGGHNGTIIFKRWKL